MLNIAKLLQWLGVIMLCVSISFTCSLYDNVVLVCVCRNDEQRLEFQRKCCRHILGDMFNALHGKYIIHIIVIYIHTQACDANIQCLWFGVAAYRLMMTKDINFDEFPHDDIRHPYHELIREYQTQIQRYQDIVVDKCNKQLL